MRQHQQRIGCKARPVPVMALLMLPSPVLFHLNSGSPGRPPLVRHASAGHGSKAGQASAGALGNVSVTAQEITLSSGALNLYAANLPMLAPRKPHRM